MGDMTTIDTITSEQIEALRYEARVHGDERMVAICDRALENGDAEDERAATLVCVQVIRDAEAMGS